MLVIDLVTGGSAARSAGLSNATPRLSEFLASPRPWRGRSNLRQALSLRPGVFETPYFLIPPGIGKRLLAPFALSLAVAGYLAPSWSHSSGAHGPEGMEELRGDLRSQFLTINLVGIYLPLQRGSLRRIRVVTSLDQQG